MSHIQNRTGTLEISFRGSVGYKNNQGLQDFIWIYGYPRFTGLHLDICIFKVYRVSYGYKNIQGLQGFIWIYGYPRFTGLQLDIRIIKVYRISYVYMDIDIICKIYPKSSLRKTILLMVDEQISTIRKIRFQTIQIFAYTLM